MFSLQTSPGSTSRSHHRRSETNPDAQRQNICNKCERGAEDERPEHHHERLEPLETRRETRRSPEQPINTALFCHRLQITPETNSETRHIKNRFTSSQCVYKAFPARHRNTGLKDVSLFLPQNEKHKKVIFYKKFRVTNLILRSEFTSHNYF